MQKKRLIDKILQESRVVAIVGLSEKPDRPSNGVARYLMSHGYRVIPVNPMVAEVLGEKSYPDLASIPEKVDVVDIFRRAEDVPPFIEGAIAIGAKTVWMQEGIVNEAAAARARAAGLQVVMDTCMKKQHEKRHPPAKPAGAAEAPSPGEPAAPAGGTAV